MDTSRHTLQALFFQLGLPDDDTSIHNFIEQHRPLPRDTFLCQARFWSNTQAGFLAEAIKQDSDWSAQVDELDCYLRESYSWLNEHRHATHKIPDRRN